MIQYIDVEKYRAARSKRGMSEAQIQGELAAHSLSEVDVKIARQIVGTDEQALTQHITGLAIYKAEFVDQRSGR